MDIRFRQMSWILLKGRGVSGGADAPSHWHSGLLNLPEPGGEHLPLWHAERRV